MDWHIHMFATDPALDKEHDPTDQDSRTSFPDKGHRSLRGRTLRELEAYLACCDFLLQITVSRADVRFRAATLLFTGPFVRPE